MRTLGKISVRLGILALATSPFAWKLASLTYALVELGVGVALVVLYFVTHGGAAAVTFKQQSSQRASFYWATTVVMAVLALGALVAVNFIAAKRGKTVDLTNKKIYSLAAQTLSTLKDLKTPVKAIGFMGTEHPAYDSLKALFERFANESDKFTYEFKDPKKELKLTEKYQIKEGQTTVILTKGEGANEQHTSLNAVGEQELTNALVKLSSSGTQKIYFLTGHAEYPLSSTEDPLSPEGQTPSLSELKQSLEQDGYTVDSLDLAQKNNEIPKDASMIVIAHASTPYSAAEAGAIGKYLAEGGRLLYFADWDAESGLEPLLTKYGIQIEKGVVADSLNPQNPFQAVGFPTDHEVSSILRRIGANMLIDTARGLTVVKEGTVPGVMTTPVLLSSPKSWIETTPDNPEPSDGERMGSIPMIMASTVDTKAAADKRFDEARVLVFGDSSLIINSNWGNEVLRNLVLNAFGWTSTQVQKITIRPPDRDISTITIDDKMLGQMQFLSIILLPQLLIALGIAIRVTRRNK